MPRALNLHVRHYPGNAFVLYERLWMEILCRLSHNDHDGFDKKSNGEVENEPSGADPTPTAPIYLAHNWCIRGIVSLSSLSMHRPVAQTHTAIREPTRHRKQINESMPQDSAPGS